MISTGSTITAHGWSKLVELYLNDTKLASTSLGFVQKMESLSDRKRVHPNFAHVKALKLWNDFLQKFTHRRRTMFSCLVDGIRHAIRYRMS